MWSRSARVVGALFALLFLLFAAGYLVLWAPRIAPRTERREVKESVRETIAFETTTVANADLWSNYSRVKRQGREGLAMRETYFIERWRAGRLLSRVPDPDRAPMLKVMEEPLPRIVEVGTRQGVAFDVDAAAQEGVKVGEVGASGKMVFDVEGSITFAGPTSVCGPEGNEVYRYYHIPLRPDVEPGATLVRVAGGPWLSLSQVDRERGVYVVEGQPGQPVHAVVNDAPGYFEDNRGSFTFYILADEAD